MYFTPIQSSVFECIFHKIMKMLISTLNSKRKYTHSVSKYLKPPSCRTHSRVWVTTHSSSNPKETEFMKKFKVVPKFWSKVWRDALCQPATQKSMTKGDFCELSDTTSQQTFPWNFGTTWNFFTTSGLIVAEVWLAVPLTCQVFCSPYILSSHWETKCIVSFGAGCIWWV